MLAKKTWSTVVAIARNESFSSAAGRPAASCRGVPLGCCCLGMWDHFTSEAPALSGAFRKGRGCVRSVSREQPHAGFQRRQQRHRSERPSYASKIKSRTWKPDARL